MTKTAMGLSYSIVARGHDGAYFPLPLVAIPSASTPEEAMGMFKREVYSFALRNQDVRGVKSVYLYSGIWRLAKCWRLEEEMRVVVQFRKAPFGDSFQACEERLGPGRFPLCSRQFNLNWQRDHERCTPDREVFR